jgi:hypothetical protein
VLDERGLEEARLRLVLGFESGRECIA